jgi:hypothetical protein
MPAIGTIKMRYPGNDPENGPAYPQKWDGQQWGCVKHRFVVTSFDADDEGPAESWEACATCGHVKREE